MSKKIIVGNTIATPVVASDWNQTDETKVDYIKNKPTLGALASKNEVSKTDLASDVLESLDKAESAIRSMYTVPYYSSTSITDVQKTEIVNIVNEIKADKGSYTVFMDVGSKRIPASVKFERTTVITATLHDSQSIRYDISVSTNGEVSTSQESIYIYDIEKITNNVKAPTGAVVMQYVQDYVEDHGGAVKSVNGQVGEVNLAAADVGALPSDTKIPTKLSELEADKNHRTVTDAEREAWSKKSDFSGKYSDLEGKPTKLSEFDNDKGYITDVPIKSVNGKTGDVVLDATDVGALPNDTQIPTKVSELTNDSGFISSIPSEYITESELNAKGYLTQHQDLSSYAKKTDIPNVPTKLSELSEDASHRTVTDTEKSMWDSKSDFSGKYDDLNCKPTIPSKTSQLTNDSGFLTEHQSLSDYAKTKDHYTKTETDAKYQLKGNYLTSVPSEYITEEELASKKLATETYVTNKIAEAELASSDVDLSGYATKDDIKDFITEVPSEYVTESELNAKGYLTQHQDLSSYAKKTDIPEVPVTSVNNKTGDVKLSASDVGALPSTYTPPDQTAAQVGADAKGTAESKVSTHNVATDSHNDIRLLISGLTTRLNALADSTDTDLDQMSEIVAYIKANKELIEGVTTNKVNVSDIIDNLTTNVSNRPLSAAQGVALKALIDAIKIPTKLSELTGDSTHRTVTDTEREGWSSKANVSDIPTKTSALTNDSGYITSAAVTSHDTDISAHANLRAFVTPQMFGAVGDGKTDDTQAINNALASGKNVYFPVGTYKVTSSLILPDGILIEGASGLSTIKTSITNGYVLKSASSDTISSANITNLKFENGNEADATTHLQSGNFVHTATDLYMNNCRVYNYYDVFYQIKSNSYIVNCRFNRTYNSFITHTTDSVIDGCYINASRYAFATKSKCFSNSYNSTSLTNCLLDYWYSVFAVSSMASGTVTGNVFNRSVNVFHDTLSTITITGNVFTGMSRESVDLSVLTAEQIASLEAEKWCIIKFDNAMHNTENHVMQSVCFTNNTGKNCDNYIYIADGVQVVPCNCEFKGNHIIAGGSGRLAAVDAGFRNTASTESAYHSMQNIFFDFWDMKEYEELPSAVLIGDGAKRVKSYPYMKAVCGGEIYTNINGVWVKDRQDTQEPIEVEPCITFVDDVSECVDKSKVYVLPDGAMYEFVSEEVEAEAETPKFTNLKDRVIFKHKQRYSMSGGSWTANTADSAIIVPVPVGVTSFTLRLNNFTKDSSYPEIYGGVSAETFTVKLGSLGVPDANGTTTANITKDASISYIVFNGKGTVESDFTDLIITVNEPIEYTTEGETIIVNDFVSTGYALVGDGALSKINKDINDVRLDVESHSHSQYLTSIPDEYVTDSELNAKGYLTQHQDLSSYAKKTDIPSVPSKTSQLTNDSGYITSSDLEDTNVVCYTAQKPASSEQAQARANIGAIAKSDIPTKISAFTNDAKYVSETQLDAAVDEAIEAAKASGDFQGSSGVYVGDGEMPDGYNVQVNPTGEIVTIPDVLQTVGNSETDTMSQKAISEELEKMKTYIDESFLGGAW